MDASAPRAGGLLVAAGLLIGALGELLVEPPAAWLAWVAARASHAALQLSDVEGGLCSGAARVAWRRVQAGDADLGRWQWHCHLDGVHPEWRLDSLEGPWSGGLSVQPGLGSVALGDLALRIDAARLPPGLGPWDLIHPGGMVALQAQSLQLTAAGLSGNGTLAWRDARSPLVSLSPFGSWHADWTLRDSQGEYTLVSERGPLHLEGRGHLAAGAAPSLQGRAWADPDQAAALEPLLRLFGTPGPDGSVALQLR